MYELLLVVGLIVFSFALRSFRIKLLRKLGALGILAATFFAFYLFTGSVAAGCGGLLIWFLLPWIELLTRIRRLRLPVLKSLEQESPPSNARFPELSDITEEIEEAGFEYVADTGWDWESMHQFFRIFYHEDSRQRASICLTEQENVSWVSVDLSSRSIDGRIYRTTNLPFSEPMKMAPGVHLRRVPDALDFASLEEAHREWLFLSGVMDEDLVEEDPEKIVGLIEQETGKQIRHNLDAGIIRMGEVAGTFRFSWRGLFYLYFQLVKDMVRMS